MSRNMIALLSLTSDLIRICLSIQRSSYSVADRFSHESRRWLKQIDTREVKPYVAEILDDLKNRVVSEENSAKKSEECLTYAVLLQNYAAQIS